LLIIKRILLLVFTTLFSKILFAQQPQKPFPRHVQYTKGTIEPSQFTQPQLDKAVEQFYTQWKARYIKNIPNKRESYIWFEEKGNKQCVSEGQGYGMVIVALMAGYDTSAKSTYDNLYRYYKSHTSNRGTHLMAWAQNTKDKDLDKTSASDGDMDIAYSLLLANAQWGNNGAINYLQEAKYIIADIMQYEINHKTWSVLLSNAIEYDSKDYFDTRSSDFMPANFKAFEQATGDKRWSNVIDNGYKLFGLMQDKYSPDAGLIPDFIVHINKAAKPAPRRYLESPYDGDYNYNACRVPWRIAIDYLLTGDIRSKTFIKRINHWIRETTNNNTYNLSAGYTLAGNDIHGRYFEALSFITPFAVSAMVDKDNQQWLNKLWNYTMQFKLKDFDYYDNTIKMLNLIIVSGNYWAPESTIK
jgi:endo-1,4-beta-D-glucanase Y